LFDDEGVTGVHAIERILWADSQSERVVKFESTLPGYEKAAFPSNAEEAEAFKTELCERLVTDTKTMQDDYATVALDSSAAFWGMIGSMAEQSEKTTLAASGEDESRYAQRTLADMRANLQGAQSVFKAFRAWVAATNSSATATEIETGLSDIGKAYSEVAGPALPAVPEDFNPDSPTDADLETPYGKLWSLLNAETDPDSDDSLINQMAAAANKMGIEEFEE
jgi:iron uptake system component EfeO